MSQMGRFERAFTSVPPRAYEANLAMGFAADERVEQRVDQP